jgi:hypothetical protein
VAVDQTHGVGGLKPEAQERNSNMSAEAEATRYIAKFGWGTQGRMLGLSKMFQDSDLQQLKKQKLVATSRPRGVLSGFLAVVPSLRASVWIPPVAGKMTPRILRMRFSDTVLREGAVFSCYWEQTSKSTLVLEDLLAWKGQSLWQTQTFAQRWATMKTVCDEFRPDPVLQGFQIRLAEYTSLQQLQPPTDSEVVEFVPNAANSKRLIWLPVQETHAKTTFLAKRESLIGPDIFTLWRGETRVGMATVRTLAMSRALALAKGDAFEVQTTWNKMFERHEIVGIA